MGKTTSTETILTITNYWQFDKATIGIILGILGIIVTIGVTIYFYRKSDEYYENLKIRNQYSVWKKSSKLIPQDIFGNDYYRYNEKIHYHYSKINNQIEEKISKGENILLIGRPLSGKTRAIYENLRKLKNYKVLIPKSSINFRNAIAPKYRKDKKIIVLDNLHNLIKSKDISLQKDDALINYISELRKNDINIIASCQSGVEFEIVCQKIDITLIVDSKENILYMPEYELVEAKKIAEEEFNATVPDTFDKTIGSLILPLQTMQNRYNDLDAYAKNILAAIKMLYIAGIYDKEGLFLVDRVKALYEKLSLNGFNFQNYLKELIKNEFIEKIIERQKIRARDVYLNYIVDTGLENLIDNFNYIISNFKDDSEALFLCARKAYDFWTVQTIKNRIDFLQISISTYNEALKFFSQKNNPTYYATAQHNIGMAYYDLSGIKDLEFNLKNGINAYYKALKVFTLKDYPQEYAATQNNLGAIFFKYSEIIDKEENLEKAIAAYNEALKVRTLKDYPQDYAQTQHNLGISYYYLAEKKDTETNLNKALISLNKALKVYSPELFPDRYKSVKSIIEIIEKACIGFFKQ
ncbi:MAG: tetratricopeptide repeat protein [Candidatus Atribacteria bacterium]|nr:MAG: tetratricopeptide repeat protein [Candidatus Atribacteria bacterium]